MNGGGGRKKNMHNQEASRRHHTLNSDDPAGAVVGYIIGGAVPWPLKSIGGAETPGSTKPP
eukprot:1442087-Rhodomonas_salina.3